jgi:hypothetical protein
VILSLVSPAWLAGQDAARASLIPVDAVTGVLAAFQTHDIVALPDAHGNAESHAFRLALIRDPRLAATIDDVIIELGNARYQDIADRYVRGEAVRPEDLRRVWQDTTVTTAGNNYAMVAELLETVRTVNALHRGTRSLRVLLGDPPIEWERVQTRADHQRYLALRDSYPAALVITEVIAKHRKALLIYGSLHFQRRNIQTNYSMEAWQAQTIVSLVEAASPARVYTIWDAGVETLGEAARSWPWPRLATVDGTTLGSADFAGFVPSVMAGQRSSILEGKSVPVAVVAFRRLSVEEQLDAVLYLGPRTEGARSYEVPPALCRQPAFLQEQMRRMALSAPAFELDRLREYCAKIDSNQ